MRTGHFDQAIPHFEKAPLEAEPNSLGLQFNLGRALATGGRHIAAIPHLEKAAASGEPRIPGALASIYAQKRRFAGAFQSAQSALAAATKRRNTELIRMIPGSIAVYENALRAQADPCPSRVRSP